MIDYLRRLIFFVGFRGTIGTLGRSATGNFLFTNFDLIVVTWVLVGRVASPAGSTEVVGIAESSNVWHGKAQ
jgi:hypothetical protein